jgi:hypothetical protein
MIQSRLVHSCARAALVALLLAFVAPPAGADTSVTTCGQEVSGHGSLDADLNCAGQDPAVTIHSGSLIMNGHTITGGGGVFCDGPCKVIGPGTVTGSTFMGVNAVNSTAKVRQVDLTNNMFAGVLCAGSCKVDGPATIRGNESGIWHGGKAIVRNVTITGNSFRATDGSNVAGNTRIDLYDSTITNNGAGIYAQGNVKIVDSTVTGNGLYGVSAGDVENTPSSSHCEQKALVMLVGSTVTGNGTNPNCGNTDPCFDVGSCLVAPRLKETTCGHSYQQASGIPGDDWDVCALD